ncbi:tetratricopeptide repeat protein [Candidatus Clostridium radicumherbarum]|uniref:Tetratricopeptide repeat protein n=1 Tax=Candidatus Clostridium radicumherbarum TaxID=3381662 RepID=A0ABW8TVN1_9CLOT
MSVENEHGNDDTRASVEEQKASEESSDGINEDPTDNFWGCKNCGNLDIEEGYNLKLCKECRDKLSRRPIPKQIKLVSLFIILVILFSLWKFPKSISSGVEYERGLQAEKAAKYATAIYHYENALKEHPESDKALVRLYVSYYEDERIEEAYKVFDQITGESPSNKKMKKELVDEVNTTTSKLDTYYNPSSELYDKIKNLQNSKTEDIVNIVKPIVDKNPKEVYGAYYLANLYFDMKNFNEASQVLSRVISNYPDFYAGYLLQAATYRELGKYDEGVEYCNKVLKHNTEDVGALITLSKIELKRRNNAKGLEYAKTAYNLDSQDATVTANLALAYHYNNLISERDKYYKIYQNSNNTDKYTDNLLKSIFDGTLQWQKQI